MRIVSRLVAAAGLGSLSLSSSQAPAPRPFDRIEVFYEHPCQNQCVSYRITLHRSGAVLVERSDSIVVSLRLAAPVLSGLLTQFDSVGIETLPGVIPSKNEECGGMVTHMPDVLVAAWQGKKRHGLRDMHFCVLDPDKVGADRARRVEVLHRFESALGRAVGIERWVVD